MSQRRFRSHDGVWQVSVWAEPLLRIQAMGAAARRHETGGILIGRYEDGGRLGVIEEATDRPNGSLFGAFWFGRGSQGLAELLQDRWLEGRHYLGEWHFHPGGSPEPSGRDHRTMAGIATTPGYQCDAPLLLILGQDLNGAPRLSLQVYPRGASPVTLHPWSEV